MRTNVSSYYDLIEFGLGNASFQTFLDQFKANKYNKLNVDGFDWDPNIQLSDTYEQLIAESNITTLPIYTDINSEALDKSLGTFKVGSNRIPTQKHRYGLDTRILRERMLLYQQFGESTLTPAARNVMFDLLFETTDKLLGGNRNALTHQRMQIVSNGQFTIGAENNPRGIQGITFDFGIEDKTTLEDDARWWTSTTHSVANQGSASDPIKDMKDKVKAKKALGHPAFHIEMSQQLFDDLLTHTAVLQRIGYSMFPQAASDAGAQTAAGNLPDDQLKAAIERLVGCPIVTRDSKSAVDVYDSTLKGLKSVTIDNFNPLNVAFVTDGKLGSIKAMKPLVFDDPTQRFGWFDGGRTLIRQRFDSKDNCMYVESEMSVLLVPSMPQYQSIITVTA